MLTGIRYNLNYFVYKCKVKPTYIIVFTTTQEKKLIINIMRDFKFYILILTVIIELAATKQISTVENIFVVVFYMY